MEPEPKPEVYIGKLSPPCPRCKRPMEDGLWCPRCAARRQIWLGLLVIIVLPLLGFGTCVAGFLGTRDRLAAALETLGVAVLLGGLFWGVSMFNNAITIRRNHDL
ncbi:MAG: hypothetical protein K8R88_08040 [Armatimonadetes bacterium]|nr:hypothetical protein [Armatimonadota bacterium]